MSEWWLCRWCGNPWRADPAFVRQPVARSLVMYRDHLRVCFPYRSWLRAALLTSSEDR